MNPTHSVSRPLFQHLHDIGINFEDLQHDITIVFGKTLNEAAGTIVEAWLNNELETLIYEAGTFD